MKKIIIIILIIFALIIIINKKDYNSERVIITQDSSVIENNILKVSMSTKKGYKIYYTLDGSLPDSNSARYNKSIVLDNNSTPDNLAKEENAKNMVGKKIFSNATLPRGTILRAVAIAPDGTKGPVETRTYFIGEDLTEHFPDAAIFSVVTDPSNLLDYNKGILVKGRLYDEYIKNKGDKPDNNYGMVEANSTQKGKEWEREVSIELFDKGNNLSWRKNGGIRIKGGFSRTFNQKSFNIYFRDEYGDKDLKYELFKDAVNIDGKTISNYKSFTLRNGGNDTDTLKFKDQWLQDLVRDRNVDTQTGRIAILFLNGEYWGVYNLQEKYSGSYYSEHYNLDKDNIVVIKEGEVEEGEDKDIKLYEELLEYCNKDMTDSNNYSEFLEKVDIKSMLDYFAIQIYIANSDWGNVNDDKLSNTQLWRVRKPENTSYGDGKWRWSLYDLENSSSMYNMAENSYDYDSIKSAMKVQPLFGNLMNNQQFKNDFYNTIREIGTNNFDFSKIENSLDLYAKNWNPFMLDYYKRFGAFVGMRDSSIISIKEFFENRSDYILDY